MITGNSHAEVPVRSIDFGLRETGSGRALPVRSTVPSALDNVVLHCTSIESFGLRGQGTMNWLRSEGISAPAAVNEVAILPCGTALLRLGQQEILLAAPPGDRGENVRQLRRKWQHSSLHEKGYDAFREETWARVVISGPAAPGLTRRISMADLRPGSFKAGQVAQTRALHLDVVISRVDHFGTVSFDIFFDVASTSFALDVLLRTSDGLNDGFSVAEMRPLS